MSPENKAVFMASNRGCCLVQLKPFDPLQDPEAAALLHEITLPSRPLSVVCFKGHMKLNLLVGSTELKVVMDRLSAIQSIMAKVGRGWRQAS